MEEEDGNRMTATTTSESQYRLWTSEMLAQWFQREHAKRKPLDSSYYTYTKICSRSTSEVISDYKGLEWLA